VNRRGQVDPYGLKKPVYDGEIIAGRFPPDYRAPDRSLTGIGEERFLGALRCQLLPTASTAAGCSARWFYRQTHAARDPRPRFCNAEPKITQMSDTPTPCWVYHGGAGIRRTRNGERRKEGELCKNNRTSGSSENRRRTVGPETQHIR
jgi:hypothetical protein